MKKQTKKVFNHKDYKEFSDKYKVQPDGRIFDKKGELKYFKMSSGGKFVRLFQFGKASSITVAKMVMLTFKPKQYKKNKIVLHLDGNVQNDSLNNLRFGTRKEQALIHVLNPENWKRISKMGKKYGPKNGKKVGHIGKLNLAKWKAENHIGHSEKIINKIQTLFQKGKTPTEISRKLNISRSSIYNHI